MDALASQADTQSSRSQEETATRDTILAAARRLAERDGVMDMSLTAVAAEAGFAPASVYAHFATRSDLLQSVIADDLATLAAAMRRAFDPRREDRQGEIRLLQTNEHRAPQAAAADADNFVQAAGAAEAIARLQQTVAKLESRPVDAWLERRLREFERALAALEGRREDRSSAGPGAEERFHKLGRSVEALEERLIARTNGTAQRLSESLEACENRLRQLVSDAQGDFAALSRRLNVVENAAFAVRPEFFASDSQQIPAPDPTPQPVPQTASSDGASAEPILAETADSSPYLDAARRSAQAAAQAQIARGRKQTRRKSETMVYLAMGSLFLFVAMLTAMGLLLRDQALHDKPSAAAPVRAAAAAVPQAKMAKADPESRLRILAEAGNPAAELLIGTEYLSAKSDALAFAWLTRAAARNQPVAEYELALLYRKGEGVHADAAQAFRWFQSAALAGNRKAMHGLATAYAEGWGTQQNLSDAARWYARAAALGSVNDEFNLGVLYERGMGVPQSLTDAYKWYAVAAAQGDQESQARITALASTLSPDELAAAQAAAAAFKADTMVPAANLLPKAEQSK